MKLLLVAINAKYIHSNPAVYSLKSYADQYRDNIKIVEYTINNSEEDIIKGIYKEQAEVIAFSCYIWNINIITRLIPEIKKVQPESIIWFGGPEVSYDSEVCLKNNSALDGIVIGEGEQTFYELTEYYLGLRSELNEISGLAYKSSACIQIESQWSSKYTTTDISITSPRGVLSMDEIPFPYHNLEIFRNKIIYYESSRGCPYSCSYCLSSIHRGVRLRNLELVKHELKAFLDHSVAQVKFVDRTFNCSKRHAMEIWQFVKENDNGITNFHFEITADLLDEEQLELLASLRPGQVQFEIGVQTTNPATVEAIRRRVDFEKLSVITRRIKEGHNIHQHLDLIAGLPLEDITAFEKSFNDVYRLRPDQFQLGFLKVLKGSLMENECKAYGIIHRELPPYEVLYTKHLSFQEVILLKGICEMVEVYYNSGQFGYSMEYLVKQFASEMQLYRKLYEYYEANGLDLVAHTRIRRFEILLDFYKGLVLELNLSENENRIELFKEILFFDLCLREDIKSRPNFAPRPLEGRRIKEIREKYKQDKVATRVEQFTYDVIASSQSGVGVRKDQRLLFNYENRDPISYSASVISVEG